MVAQRDAWTTELLKLVAEDKNILVLDADLATSTKSVKVAEAYPEQFLQMGIAEQNMVAVGAGLASVGDVPWVSTFGVFLTQRALDQIRMLVAQTRANVKFAGHYTGVLNGGSGKTHQDIEDLAVLRAMPGMTVIVPADGAETRAAVRWATAHKGPVYLRLARDDAGELDAADQAGEQLELVPDTLRRLRDGDGSVVVISTGSQTMRTAAAVEELAGRSWSITHLHAPFLKPLSGSTVRTAVAGARLVVTVEEHSVIGGLGGLVAESLAERPDGPLLHRIGLPDAWADSAPNAFLLDRFGLSAQRVAEQIERALAALATGEVS